VSEQVGGHFLPMEVPGRADGPRGSADPTHEGRDRLLPVRGFFPGRREFRLRALRPCTLPGCASSANLTARF